MILLQTHFILYRPTVIPPSEVCCFKMATAVQQYSSTADQSGNGMKFER